MQDLALGIGKGRSGMPVTLSPKLFSGACLATALGGCLLHREEKRVDVASFRPLLIRITVCSDEEAGELM